MVVDLLRSLELHWNCTSTNWGRNESKKTGDEDQKWDECGGLVMIEIDFASHCVCVRLRDLTWNPQSAYSVQKKSNFPMLNLDVASQF